VSPVRLRDVRPFDCAQRLRSRRPSTSPDSTGLCRRGSSGSRVRAPGL